MIEKMDFRDFEKISLDDKKEKPDVAEINSICHVSQNAIRNIYKKIEPQSELINEGRHILENLDHRDVTPEQINAFTDFYLEIFRNQPYRQFLLHKDNPLTPISPQEALAEPGKDYFSLEELENFQLPEDVFHWVDRGKLYELMKQKIEKKSFITHLRENGTDKTVGLLLGRQATLKEIFETEEIKNPLLFSKYFDANLLANEELFFKKMQYHCNLEPQSEILYISCIAFHPKARGGNSFQVIQKFLNSLPKEVFNLPLVAEVEHDGAGHDISVAFADAEFFGILENGHPLSFCKKLETYAEVFLEKSNQKFVERFLAYRREKKDGKKHPLDNPNVEILDTEEFGKGVFAKAEIKEGDIIAVFTGEKYQADFELDLPEIMRDHCIQVGEREYIYAKGSLAEKINHSCEPNCGLKDFTKIVAMREIKPGEQITWDYRMSEDSNWIMECKCGSPHCSRSVGNFKNMPDDLKKKYFREGYLSQWIIDKYTKI